MLKTLFSQVKQYKKVSILTPIFTALEVVMEILIPFVISALIDKGIEAGDIGQIYLYGGLMVVLAFLSLMSGILAGRYAAAASASAPAGSNTSIESAIRSAASIVWSIRRRSCSLSSIPLKAA